MNLYSHVPFFKPIWVKFDIGSLHNIPLRVCEFREDRCSESLTSLKGVDEIFPEFYVRVTVHSNKFLYNKTN